MDARASAATFAVRAPIRPADLPGLSQRVCTLMQSYAGSMLTCDVADVGADAVTVDALARLALVARRRGCRVRLANCSPELADLVRLVGLEDVLDVESLSPPAGPEGRTEGTASTSTERT